MTTSSIIVCGTLKSETFFYLLQTGRASRLGLKILYCEKIFGEVYQQGDKGVEKKDQL